MFDAGYFDLGMGRGPVARDFRLRNNHPINICRQLTPMVDTPFSSSQAFKYPTSDARAASSQTVPCTNQEDQIGAHFKGPEVKESLYKLVVPTASSVANLWNRFRMKQSSTTYIRPQYEGNHWNTVQLEDWLSSKE